MTFVKLKEFASRKIDFWSLITGPNIDLGWKREKEKKRENVKTFALSNSLSFPTKLYDA